MIDHKDGNVKGLNVLRRTGACDRIGKTLASYRPSDNAAYLSTLTVDATRYRRLTDSEVIGRAQFL